MGLRFFGVGIRELLSLKDLKKVEQEGPAS
jgi:hypothetical protein